jgi:hypothetical protein
LDSPCSPPNLLQLDAAAPLLLLPNQVAEAEMLRLYDSMVTECAAKQARDPTLKEAPIGFSTSLSSSSSNPITAALELLAPNGPDLGHHGLPELPTGSAPAQPNQPQPCGPLWLPGVAGSAAAHAWKGSFAGMLLDLQMVLDQAPAGRNLQDPLQRHGASTAAAAVLPALPAGADLDHQEVRAAVVRNLLRHFAAHHLWACCSFLLASAVTSGCVSDLGDVAGDLAAHVHKEVAGATALPHDRAALAAAAACDMAVSGRLPDAAAHPADQGYFGVCPGAVTPRRTQLAAGGAAAGAAGAKPPTLGGSSYGSMQGVVYVGGSSTASSPDHLPLLQRVHMLPRVLPAAATPAVPVLPVALGDLPGPIKGSVPVVAVSSGATKHADGEGRGKQVWGAIQHVSLAQYGGSAHRFGDGRGSCELQSHLLVAAMLVVTLLLLLVSAH